MACYKLNMQPDDGVWMVTSDDFPELTTFGETTEEACRNGRNAIEESIAARISDGVDIPAPMRDTTGQGHFVELPMMVLLKASLYMIMREKGMTRADLQRALNWAHREQVDRLFRIDHQSKLDQLESAFKAIGHPLRIEVPFPQAA